MALPDSYVQKYNAVPAYFEAIRDAQAPERFTMKFMEGLGFTSSNDRLFIKVLKDLGFINDDGVPQDRYYKFLDKSESGRILAEAIKDAYSDLFAVNKNAQTLNVEDVKNKLKTLYQGKKSEVVIDRIAKTFKSLCDEADFATSSIPKDDRNANELGQENEAPDTAPSGNVNPSAKQAAHDGASVDIGIRALQYHINIVLPESRDQGVYDAIFKSLRHHLG